MDDYLSSSYPPKSHRHDSDESFLRTRERSVRDAKPFSDLSDEEYFEKQCGLYPPDGYFNETKRVKIEGKRRKVTQDNRPWPAEYKREQAIYEASKDRFNQAESNYYRQRENYRAAEADIRDMYERDSLPAALKVDRSEIYRPTHHRALQEAADLREEEAYQYANDRMTTFEKWPRINRKPLTDRRHYDAVTCTWGQHEVALHDRNNHSTYGDEKNYRKGTY